MSPTNSDLTVYMAGRSQNLTRIRADVIEAEIERKYSAVVKIEQSRHSLKILCSSEQQKELVLRGGTVAGVDVKVTVPWGKENRLVRKSGVKKVICGVPPEYSDVEVDAASRAMSASRKECKEPRLTPRQSS